MSNMQPCNVRSLSYEEIEAKRLENLPKIYNFAMQNSVSEPAPSEQAVLEPKTHVPKGLEQDILNALNSITTGEGSPRFVHTILETQGIKCTNKQVCNKMWAMAKKGLIKHLESGAYLIMKQPPRPRPLYRATLGCEILCVALIFRNSNQNERKVIMTNLSNTTIVLLENGTYNLVDNDFGWAIANGTHKEMVRLQMQLNRIQERRFLSTEDSIE